MSPHFQYSWARTWESDCWIIPRLCVLFTELFPTVVTTPFTLLPAGHEGANLSPSSPILVIFL